MIFLSVLLGVLQAAWCLRCGSLLFYLYRVFPHRLYFSVFGFPPKFLQGGRKNISRWYEGEMSNLRTSPFSTLGGRQFVMAVRGVNPREDS